jgi:hypothetical protein
MLRWGQSKAPELQLRAFALTPFGSDYLFLDDTQKYRPATSNMPSMAKTAP